MHLRNPLRNFNEYPASSGHFPDLATARVTRCPTCWVWSVLGSVAHTTEERRVQGGGPGPRPGEDTRTGNPGSGPAQCPAHRLRHTQTAALRGFRNHFGHPDLSQASYLHFFSTRNDKATIRLDLCCVCWLLQETQSDLAPGTGGGWPRQCDPAWQCGMRGHTRGFDRQNWSWLGLTLFSHGPPLGDLV